MRVTITIEEGETRTVIPAGESSTIETATRSGDQAVEGPIDGGPARPVADLEESGMEIPGGPSPEAPGQRPAGAIDAGPAPVLVSDGQTDGPLPLGRSLD